MTTRGDIGRALLALALATAAWLNGGCLDSIVSADCSEAGCPDPGTGPDAGSGDDRDRFTEGSGRGGGGGGGGDGDDADAGLPDDADAAPDEECPEETPDRCPGTCVDLSSDPMSCGTCGNECDSGICQDGECLELLSGHAVLIGHDFASRNPAMGRVLGNAVFLSLGSQVDVVTYHGSASPSVVASVNAAISTYAASIGRSWHDVPATSADQVPALLATADVLLVYPQGEDSPGQLTALGAGWAAALDQFTADRNGTVIVLDGDQGSYQVMAGAGLMDVTASAAATGETVEVVGGSDALATNVPLEYYAATHSASFTGTTAPVVVETGAGDPVVLHRAVY